MPIFDLFSKRRKRAAGDVPDVYVYEVPVDLRDKIIHIWGDALGHPSSTTDPMGHINPTYQNIVQILRREYGVFALHTDTHDPNNMGYAFNELCKFFLDTGDFRNVSDSDK